MDKNKQEKRNTKKKERKTHNVGGEKKRTAIITKNAECKSFSSKTDRLLQDEDDPLPKKKNVDDLQRF